MCEIYLLMEVWVPHKIVSMSVLKNERSQKVQLHPVMEVGSSGGVAEGIMQDNTECKSVHVHADGCGSFIKGANTFCNVD